MKKLLAMLIIFCFFFSVRATEMIVDPISINIDLTAGCKETENITVRWTGDEPSNCYIYTYIQPDNIGIDVTYSEESPFMIEPDRDYKIQMTVETQIDMKPGTYTILTDFICQEGEEEQPEQLPDDTGDDEEDDGDTNPEPPSGDDDETPVLNRPPTIEKFEGNITGYPDEKINYSVIGKDLDGHNVKYEFDWDDETTNLTDYMDERTEFTITHVWNETGFYDITVRAYDGYTWSERKHLDIRIREETEPEDEPDLIRKYLPMISVALSLSVVVTAILLYYLKKYR